MDGEFDDNHFSVIRDVVARVGVPMCEHSA